MAKHVLEFFSYESTAGHCKGCTTSVSIRQTPRGRMCLACWKDVPICERCHENFAATDGKKVITFRGEHLCGDCMNEDADDVEDWLAALDPPLIRSALCADCDIVIVI